MTFVDVFRPLTTLQQVYPVRHGVPSSAAVSLAEQLDGARSYGTNDSARALGARAKGKQQLTLSSGGTPQTETSSRGKGTSVATSVAFVLLCLRTMADT